MAGDNTSVGKISLEIDLTQDLENEIGNAANKIARGLQDKLSKTKIKVGDIDFSNITKAVEQIPNSMNSAITRTKAIFENASLSIKKSIEDNITKTLQNSTSQMGKLPSNSISKPTSSPITDVLSSKMPEVYTPKFDTSFIDAEFSEVSEKASNIIKEIGERAETTAKNATFSFTGTTDQIKSNVDDVESNAEAAIDTTETKANGAIASIIARLKNIQMPKFDFSKFQPKGNSVNSGGTDAQQMQLDLLTKQMDAFSAKADEARAHIMELQAQIDELSKPTGNPASDFINTAQIEKLQEELKKSEDEEDKFGDKSDAINIKIATLTDKMEQAANATNNNTKAVHGKGDSLDSTGQKGTIFGGIFERLTGIMKNAGNASNSASKGMSKLGSTFDMVGRMMDRMLIRMVVFNTVIKGLTDFSTFMGKALMTNTQFANSLEQVKSNLEIAFMPIYNAILPALNSLISALATVSSYVASFMSQLFGTTYQASAKSAQALQSQVGALDITDKQAKKTADSLGTVGNSAKKTASAIGEAAAANKKGLAGFDQLNKLGDPTSSTKTGKSAGSGVITPVTPTANMSPIETATQGWADKFKTLMAGLFAPFKQAWATEGLNTINAAKNALSGIEDLIGSIAKSFYSVWTNGTGTAILTNILKIFQDILNIIGNVSKTFASAWNSGNIGTQIVQTLANAFNNILALIDKVLQSLQKVFAQEGPTFANLFMQALKAASGVIENVTQKLGWIWDHGGQHAFEGLVKLGLKIGELALFIYTNFVAPLAIWCDNMIAPAIAKILDIVGSLADAFSKAVDIIIKILTSLKSTIATVVDKITGFKGAIDAITIVVGAFVIALLAYNADAIITAAATLAMNVATSAWSIVSGIATIATTAFGVAVAFLTSPITLVILAIGLLIAAGVLIYKNWDTIKAKASEVWNAVKSVIGGAIDGIKGFFESLGEKIQGVGTLIQTTWNNVLSFFGSLPGKFLGFVGGIGTAIQNGFNSAISFITSLPNKALQWGKDFINGLVNGIKSGLGSVGDAVGSIADKITSFLHFSVPDQGPLTTYESWMPDFVGGLAKGITNSKGLITNAIKGLSTDMSVNLTASTGTLQQPALSMVSNNGSTTGNTDKTNSMDDFKQAVVEAIIEAIKSLKTTGGDKSSNGSTGGGDVVLKVNESEFARIAIRAIYNIQRQTGVSLLTI